MKKCPECASMNLILCEHWAGRAMSYQQTEGVIDKEGCWDFQGSAFQVEATCKRCGHNWIVRGATSVEDLHKKQAEKGKCAEQS